MSSDSESSLNSSTSSLLDEPSSEISEGEDSEQELGVQPYMLEPEWSSSDEEGRQHDAPVEQVEEDRTRNLDWCECENCQMMDRNVECVCCAEIPQIVDKNNEVEGTPPSCITLHPGFSAVCLDRWVLQVAWHQYRQQYAQTYNGPEHKLYRHIAYRQLVRWCWGILGKEIRVPLSSCAVSCIRAHFPPPGLEENFEFVGFQFPDE